MVQRTSSIGAFTFTPTGSTQFGELTREDNHQKSLAIVLDDSTIENGCLWLIPGSHKQGALQCFTDRGVVGRLYTDVDNLDWNEPEPIDVPAGSLVYFHGDIVHGSQVNRSEVERRLLLLTYQPAGLPRWQRKDVRPVAA